MFGARFISIGVALSVGVSASAASVVVVDSALGPGSQYSSIDDAIHAAAEGDLLLVRAGNYPPFSLTDRSLSIVADAGADVEVGGFWVSSRIQNLSPGKRVAIRGIRFTSIPFSSGTSDTFAAGLSATNCDGTIEIEDVTTPGSAGLYLASCDSVWLSRVTCTGAFGAIFSNSTVVATDCAFVGVDGIDASSGFGQFPSQPSTQGEAGLSVAFGGSLTLSDCTVTGGRGGDGLVDWNGACLPASSGGAAIRVNGAAATIRIVANQPSLIPGSPGVDAGTCTSNATSGLPVQASVPVNLSSITAEPLSFSAANVAREGQPLSITMTGPSVFAHWLVSASSSPSPWLSGGVGHLLVGVPYLVIPIGTAPTPPNWNLSFTVPELGPGVSGVSLRIQALGCASPSDCVLGGITSVVLLDAAL